MENSMHFEAVYSKEALLSGGVKKEVGSGYEVGLKEEPNLEYFEETKEESKEGIPVLARSDSTEESVYTDVLDFKQVSLSKIVKEEFIAQVEVLKEEPHQDEFWSVLKEPKEEGISEKVNPQPQHSQVTATEESKNSVITSQTRSDSLENNVKNGQAIKPYNKKIYRCSDCKYECNRKSNLQLHMLTHSNVKQFTCSDCDYKCNRKSHLKEHMVAHSDIKQFRCSDCGYECSRKGNLKQHMLTHSNTKQFRCSDCDYECNRKSHLERHMLTHSNFKQFKCSECDYGCNQKSHLKQHMFTHSAVKQFRCSGCDYECNQKFDLRRHMLKRCPQRNVIETP